MLTEKHVEASLPLIKRWEGFRAEAYPDPGTGGEPWTIGYGTTARAGVGISPRPGLKISREDADMYLRRAVDKFAADLARHVKRKPGINQGGAMISLAYNIGPSAFVGSSALRRFNAGDDQGAADAFLLWNKSGGKVMQGLKNRRAEERIVFMTPDKKPEPVEQVEPRPRGFFGWFPRLW